MLLTMIQTQMMILETTKGNRFDDSDGSSADPFPEGLEDEDDADPAGIIVVDLERSVPCFCLDNATTQDNGQFYEEISFRSISGDSWFIYQVTGFYHELSQSPPNIPIFLLLDRVDIF